MRYWFLTGLLLMGGVGLSAQQRTWEPRNSGIPVVDSLGRIIPEPFLGGFDVPRPQLVDLGSGRLSMFVQERRNGLMRFEQSPSGEWLRIDERFHDLPIGDWYRFVDVDGDGLPDLLAEMPMAHIRYWRNTGTPGSPQFTPVGDTIRDIVGEPIIADRQNILNAVDIDCNGHLDLFIGSVAGTVGRWEHATTGPAGDPRFRLVDDRWMGIEILGPEATGEVLGDRLVDRPSMHGANTLSFADLSRRGVLDLFWGDFFEPGLLLIRNQGTCAEPDFHTKPEPWPVGNHFRSSGYNAPAPGDVDRDGLMDLVIGVIGGAFQPRITATENLWLVRQDSLGHFSVTTKRMIPTIDVGSEAAPALVDLFGDGRYDLVVGNRISPHDNETANLTWFENIGTATAPSFRERGLLPIRGHFNYSPSVGDLDGDGKPDLVLGTWSDQVLWYRNTGTRESPSWVLADSALITLSRGTNATPTLGDVDGDGLLDLVVGRALGIVSYYRNVGTRTAPRFDLVEERLADIKMGRRSMPTLVDMNGDGRPDLLVGSEEGEVQLWLNQSAADGVRFVRDTTFALRSEPYAAPAAAPLFGDGVMHLLVGTEAGGLRWYRPRP